MQNELFKTARDLERQGNELLRMSNEIKNAADTIDALWEIETGFDNEPSPAMIKLYKDALPFADRKASEIRQITSDEAKKVGRTVIELVVAATLIRRNNKDRSRRNLGLKVLHLYSQGNPQAYIAKRCGTTETNVSRIIKAGFTDLIR